MTSNTKKSSSSSNFPILLMWVTLIWTGTCVNLLALFRWHDDHMVNMLLNSKNILRKKVNKFKNHIYLQTNNVNSMFTSDENNNQEECYKFPVILLIS